MKIFAMCVLLASTAAFAHEEAAPPAAIAVSQDAQGMTYGALMPEDAKAVSIAAAAASPAALLAGQHAFRGRITEVCQQQGCWMVLEDQGQFARVFMHDHSFSVPKQATGEAIVYGSLTQHRLTAAQIEHLRSESSGKVTESEWRIDAVSVRIAPTAVKTGGED